ncbi:MAG: helix-turn-helix domain-containing protein [Clostridia bacterium]|nr:helix-turn-helix domain-containing protein [Clostridia bacterium]
MTVDCFEKCYHYRKDSSYVFEGHRHSGRNGYEVNIVLAGCLEVTCGASVFRLRAGELGVWHTDCFHCNRTAAEGMTEFLSIHFDSADRGQAEEPAVYHLSDSSRTLVGLIDEEAGGNAVDGNSGKINRAALDLLEALLLRLEGMGSVPERTMTGNPAIYHRAVTVMGDHLHEPLTVPMIARQCGVCVTALKNAFAECAGKGVKAYFVEMKMEAARQMLLDGAGVDEIAAKLGFSSASYFSQCFRRLNGCTASEYRSNAGRVRP